MSLAAGTRLGSYEIVRQIGAGGMGEVYRARDTNLGRDVALKILPDLFTSDADRVARFKREAQMLASLNHPNIAQIYGLESNALVMELVDGEDLSAIIARGPLPAADALAIARQIAEALEAAHEQGIVHRDLKPANIKVRPDGTVKVLDFGLAKAVEPPDAAASAVMNSPTMTVRGTQLGVIVGTAAYMSPEQAAGKSIDKRSDLWALGVVLLEMLTGRQTFNGDTISHVLASVLKDAPDFSALPAETPASIRTLLRRCLEKDRKKRLDSAAVARMEIEEAMSGAAPAAAIPPGRARRRLWPIALASALAAAGIAAVWIATRPEPVPSTPVTRSVITLPDGWAIRSRQRAVALSPDGSRLAIVLHDATNRSQLFVRALDTLDLKPLPGTDEASDPFWSPDGRALGFFTTRELKRVDLPDGPVRSIAHIEQGRGASWGSGDRAIFSALAPQSRTVLTLFEVSMTGASEAVPIAAVRPAEPVQSRLPTILPAGAGTLYLSDAGRGWSLSLLDTTGRVRQVGAINSEVHYVPPGWLAGVHDGVLLVQPFDLRTQSLSGSPQAIVGDVVFDDARAVGQVSFSSAPPTSLVYQREAPVLMSQLTWLNPDGGVVSTLGEPAQFTGEIALSPDGRRGIVAIRSSRQAAAQLWIVDLASGLRTPLTADMTAGSDAVWSRDGRRVAYRGTSSRFIIRAVDAPESSAIVLPTGNDAWLPTGWTLDGLGIFTAIYRSPRGLDIAIVPAHGKGAPRFLVESAAQEQAASLSPDGRWLAYISNESGRNQIHVTSYPSLGTRWPLTSDGAAAYEWAGANTILYSGGPAQQTYRLTFRSGGGAIEVTDRTAILSGRRSTANALPAYSAPLKRYLDTVVVPGQRTDSPLVLVTNWQSEIRK